MSQLNLILFAIFSLFFVSKISFASDLNLHLIDKNDETGFEIYRYSKPDKEDIITLCKLGISEVMVLSGTADKYEFKYQNLCPTLKVIYNEIQDSNVPVTVEFLNYFDNWVESAQKSGKKIAFRCQCGCHRTGRLAAYYQMKYQNMPVDKAIEVMMTLGKYMWSEPQLVPQVEDLNDYIQGLGCNQRPKFCVNR